MLVGLIQELVQWQDPVTLFGPVTIVSLFFQ